MLLAVGIIVSLAASLAWASLISTLQADVPICALPCLSPDNIGLNGCSSDESQCMCQSQSAMSQCFRKDCEDEEDLEQAQSLLGGFCAALGVDVGLLSSSSSPQASPTSTTAAISLITDTASPAASRLTRGDIKLIVGLSVGGGLAALLLIFLIVALCWRRRRSTPQRASLAVLTSDSEDGPLGRYQNVSRADVIPYPQAPYGYHERSPPDYATVTRQSTWRRPLPTPTLTFTEKDGTTQEIEVLSSPTTVYTLSEENEGDMLDLMSSHRRSFQK